jgi:hypothetical protein
MPQEVMNGSAVVFGISNNGTPITINGTAHFIVDMAKGTHKFKIEDIEDENGFTTSTIATDPHMEMDITFVPSGRTVPQSATSGGTRAGAYEALNGQSDVGINTCFLKPLSRVLLANFKVAAFNGPYQYRGDETIDLTHKEAKCSLKIRKWDDAAQNESLTTTVQES